MGVGARDLPATTCLSTGYLCAHVPRAGDVLLPHSFIHFIHQEFLRCLNEPGAFPGSGNTAPAVAMYTGCPCRPEASRPRRLGLLIRAPQLLPNGSSLTEGGGYLPLTSWSHQGAAVTFSKCNKELESKLKIPFFVSSSE